MRNEPVGFWLDVWEWLRSNTLVLGVAFIGWSILNQKIKKISHLNTPPVKMNELDDEIKLPKWFQRAQLFAKPLSVGFISAITFLNLFPGVKPALSSMKIYISESNFVTVFDIFLMLFICGALPCIVLAANKVDITQYIKKS